MNELMSMVRGEEPPLSEVEVALWLKAMRVIARNLDITVESIIEDLIRHAKSDEMSEEDRQICINTLKYLRSIH